MEFSQLYQLGLDFYHHYPLFCYIAAGLLALFALWKPFKVLKSVFWLTILVIIIYLIFQLIGSMDAGIKMKDKAIHRTEKALE